MPSDRSNSSKTPGFSRVGAPVAEDHRNSRIPQTRTKFKRSDIENAALSMISEAGASKLTHRLISKAANVSIAATTYHYADKHDIIVSASLRLMRKFRTFMTRTDVSALHSGSISGPSRAALSSFLCALSEDRYLLFNCWAELMLYSARQANGALIGRAWYKMLDSLAEASADINILLQCSRIQGLLDLLVGLTFVSTSQNLDACRIGAVLRDGDDPLSVWKPMEAEGCFKREDSRATRKSAETKAKVLAAAIELLAEDGPGAVTYRAVARKAGVAQGTPFYQFRTVSALLSEAQHKLFEDSKDRYRAAADRSVASDTSISHLVARTSSVFWREVTDHAGKSASSYSLWLRATRDEQVRLMVWNAIEDQLIAWKKVLGRLNPEIRPIDPLLAQALFVGKLIRVIAIDSVQFEESQIQAEFDRDIRAIVNSSFWF